jgi:hypothetical protein
MWFRSCSTSNRITQLTWGIDHKMYLYFQLHLKTFYLSWIPASTLTLLLVMDLGFDVGTSPGPVSWLWHWCWSPLTASILVLDISLDIDTLPCLISWPWHLTPLCVLDLGFEIGTLLCPGSEPWHWHPSLSWILALMLTPPSLTLTLVLDYDLTNQMFAYSESKVETRGLSCLHYSNFTPTST